MKLVILIVTMVVMLAGCASTTSTGKNFNTTSVKTVFVKIDCTDVKSNGINPPSVYDYCQMLRVAAKASIRKNGGCRIDENAVGMDIKITLEKMYGDNDAAARFLVGLGADKSIITTHVDVVRDGRIIAEGRLIEKSAIPRIVGDPWANEKIITQDIEIVADRIADFVVNQRNFEPVPEQPNYRP